MVGLAQVKRRAVGEYSKGMSRRLGLAQALINDPELLILDEPTSGLDPIGTRQVKDLLIELGRRGTTILLSSHLLADVEDVCDRMVILYGGKIRKGGRTEDLLSDSKHTVIRTSRLDDDTVQQIEDVLQRRGIGIDSIEQPRQRLEELFMGIVEQAQLEATDTSGALQGGETAAFLTRDEAVDTGEGDSLIDALQTAVPTAAVRSVEKMGDDASGKAESEQQQVGVLDDLLAEPEADVPTAPSTDVPSKPQDHDGSVIDDLLGDSDDSRSSNG
ncbi:MAG: ABC transporter ATP-binding protein [Planctomycetota bacterium]|nr:ABC transporter ATP-binding protein [Planctomycetota bacterium]